MLHDFYFAYVSSKILSSSAALTLLAITVVPAPSHLTLASHLASPPVFSQCHSQWDPVLKSDHVLPVLKALQKPSTSS